jgi:eukaryotic-like serine/threonine-protein kinase
VSRSGDDELAEAKTLSSEDALGVTVASTDGSHDTAPVARVHDVTRGTTVGRYVVLDTIGSGTMGVVVAAIDPTLDRKVAIKLVKPSRDGTTSGRQRLLREAQAMARLQHPNVVTVFEVGTFADQVFLAMEFIAGGTLAGWLAQRHTQREIIDAFIAAGRGLAAAHRAGIVHRDFKPSNVLVATDGRVRVADFGLATAPELISEMSTPTSLDDLAMTSTGAILGTPTYMAPEQHRGEPATARADQFAFAVALYDALYGQVPFEGDAYQAYSTNVLAGRVVEPKRGATVPAWLRKVLLRALAVAPEDRYPDMDAMLAALSHDSVARRKYVALGVAAIAVAAGGAAFALHERASDADLCAAADKPMAAWDDRARTALHLAFSRSTAPDAESSFEHTARELDDRANALRAARRDACEATAVRHEQSVELLDRRFQCLDGRAAVLSQLIDVLSDHPDAATVERAPEAAASHSSLADCADSVALLADRPRPTNPMMQAQVASLEAQVTRADALGDAGRATQAHAVYAALLPEIDRVDYTPLRTRVRLHDALSLMDLTEFAAAITELRQTGELAAAAHDDVALAKAWTLLYGAVGLHQSKIDEARALEPAAAAAVMRAGNTLELHGGLEQSRGAVELAAGNYPAACEHFATAIRELGKAIDPKDPYVVDVMNNYAIALENAGRYDEARQTLDRAIAIRSETVGADHVDMASLHHELGALLDDTSHVDDSLAEFKKAYDIELKAYPRDSPQAAIEQISIGVDLVELGRPAEALTYNEAAVQTFRRHPDDDREMLATGLLDLANAYRELHRSADAIRTYDEALALTIALRGEEHADVADVMTNEAAAYSMAGDHARTAKLLQRALAIRQKVLGPTHPDVAKAFGAIGEEAYARRDYREAIDYMTRAIDMLAKQPGTPLPIMFGLFDERGHCEHGVHRDADAVADLTRAHDGYLAAKLGVPAAQAELGIADVLWDDGKRADAIVAAKSAETELATLSAPDVLATARDWLAKHGR